MKQKTFWITNGVNSTDEFMVIVKCLTKVKCNHCYNTRDGFIEIGNSKPLSIFTYAICNSCLYNPATGMVNNLFIAVSKNKDGKRFEKLLDECKNKEQYLKELVN